MPASIRDLKVWNEAVALASDVIRGLRPANRREIKGVIEDAMRCAAAVATHIADGYSSADPRAQQAAYTAARREVARLETYLSIARQAELLPAPAHVALSARLQQVHRMLGGFLVYLDRQQAQPRRDVGTGAAAAAPAAG